MATHRLPTFRQVDKLLAYDPDTGVFHWKVRRGWVAAGSVAGYRNPENYVAINLFNVPRKAHRVAWLLTFGRWPPAKAKLDHINGNPSDNRIVNLRLVTDWQNAWNSKAHSDNAHGYKGLTWLDGRQKWQVRICARGKRKTLGYYATVEEAQRVYAQAATRLFGEFARME
jgi:hypothetical protein